MFRRLGISFLLVAVLAFGQGGLAQAQTTPGPTPIGKCEETKVAFPNNPPLETIYLICMPPDTIPWNHQLVIFAHGFVPNIPVLDEPYLPADQLSALGTYLPNVINSMGYAFAMTSYPVNGLAILPGVQDVLNLVEYFKENYSNPVNVFLTGASEGGLVTTLALERAPDVFKGGLAACGPIGSFQNQINHFGDFRVLFDYYFPGVLPESAINIPAELAVNWETVYVPKIAAAMAANPARTLELFKVAKVPADPTGAHKTAIGLLWYNVFATMDAQAKLGGNPFDNKTRWYYGSSNDWALNAGVKRYHRTAPTATMNQYETYGKPTSPLVTLHTTGDPIVPYWHEPLYTLKTLNTGAFFKRTNIPISRYGHCAFTEKEAVFAFALMILKSTGTLPLSMVSALADGSQPAPMLTEQEFWEMNKALAPKDIYIPIATR